MSPRSGTISISGDGATKTFTVNQAGGSASLTISPTNRDHEHTSLSNQLIEVNSNSSWTASRGSYSWITITSGSSGSNNGTVIYSVTENTSPSSRTGTITVSGEGITRTFTVTQTGSSTGLTIYPESCDHNANFSAYNGVWVTTNVSWTVSPNVNWISINGSDSGNGNGGFMYDVKATT
jgi:hypothetical protein